METPATIFVVDDDPAVRRALEGVGRLLGLPIASFGSAVEFLAAYERSQGGCLVLDIKMPAMTGLELQRKLRDDGIRLPVILISGHADVRIAVEAMSMGAITVLEKPFSLEELISHIRRAVERDRLERELLSEQVEVRARFALLTTRDREVLDLIMAGTTNKQIAVQLHLSVRAIEDRRTRLMKKLNARTLAELVQLASAYRQEGPAGADRQG